MAHANNFTGNNAFVFWTGAAGAPLPEPVPNPAPGFNAQNGFYNNSTMLSFSLTWNVPAGEVITFPNSIDAIAEVPEPGSLSFFGVGTLALLCCFWHRRVRQAN